ncbi:hypothetical protein ACFLTP_09310 [Chloroflexota bacterium]
MVPNPIGHRTIEENQASAEAAIEDIINALTKPLAEETISNEAEKELITVMGEDYAEAVENMNALFMEKCWGDGLPLIPPTDDAVKEMLKGTSHSPDEAVGVVEPRCGVATVKMIAINAVMAGCKPEYLPVVLAAVKASLDSAYNLRAVQVTTGTAIPMLVISGPICKELDINYRAGSMGPGYRANATIGRAFNLICTTVGGRWPGTTSMSSFADPGRFTWCFGEDDAALPPGWEPLRTEKGYKQEKSIIFIMSVLFKHGIYSFMFQEPYGETLKTVARTIKESLAGWSGESALILGPDIAQNLARGAPTKSALKEDLFKSARIPWGKLKNWEAVRQGAFPPGLDKSLLTDESMVSPRLIKPEDLNIIVTGGAGNAAYFTIPWVRTQTTTELIDKWR